MKPIYAEHIQLHVFYYQLVLQSCSGVSLCCLGLGGSGKQSLTRRAAYMSSTEIGQIALIPFTRAKTLSSIHK